MTVASKKLTPGQRHILTLIRTGSREDGWAPVSKVVAQLFTDKQIPGDALPTELCEFERVGDDGAGRARLTPLGANVLLAMEYLL